MKITLLDFNLLKKEIIKISSSHFTKLQADGKGHLQTEAQSERSSRGQPFSLDEKVYPVSKFRKSETRHLEKFLPTLLSSDI